MAGRKPNLKSKKTKIRQHLPKYKKLGWCVLPTRDGGKNAYWDGWTTISKEDAWKRMSYAPEGNNIGIRCGDDVAVIDIDHPELAQDFYEDYFKEFSLPKTAVVVRGKERTVEMVEAFSTKGHLYFKRPEWMKQPINKEKVCGIEIRTGNQYLVAPNSYHEEDGNWYRWENIDMLQDLPEFPKELYDYTVQALQEIGETPYPEDRGKRRFGIEYKARHKDDEGKEFEKTAEFQQFLNHINAIASIPQVCSEVGMTRKRDGWLCIRGHDSKSASAKHFKKNNTIKCFGCGMSVGAVGLLMQGGYTFPQAYERLAEMTGVPVPKRKYFIVNREETEANGQTYNKEVYTDVSPEEEEVIEHNITIEYDNLLPPLPKPIDDGIIELLKEEFDEMDDPAKKLVCLAVQGTGKSYASAYYAAYRYQKGLSTVYFTRSHDEIKQWINTVKKLTIELGGNPSEVKIVHLHGKMAAENGSIESNNSLSLPEEGLCIIASPYAYMGTRGETGYMYPIMGKLKKKAYGENTLVFIDELAAMINGQFMSVPLGGRYVTKDLHQYKEEIKVATCPFSARNGNCSNCEFDPKLYVGSDSATNQIKFYQPIKRVQGSKLVSDKPKMEEILSENDRELKIEDNTMVMYYIQNTKRRENAETRTFSTGGKGETELRTNLHSYLHDLTQNRLVSPHVVYSYPYDKEREENLMRSLTEEEVEKRQNGEMEHIVFPRQVCGVPMLQGWDALPFDMLKGLPVAMFCPNLSLPQGYFMESVYENVKYYKRMKPNTLMENVLILSIEDNLYPSKKVYQDLLVDIGNQKKILYFARTAKFGEAASAQLSQKIRTVFYDGVEHNRCGLPKSGNGEDYYRIYISYCYGPLGQGINFVHPVVIVDTGTERPKHVNTGGLVFQEITDQNYDDICHLSYQCAGRIMRPEDGVEDDQKRPRVIIYFGRNSKDVAASAVQFFGGAGHSVSHIHCGTNLQLLKKATLRFSMGEDIEDLIAESEYEIKIQDDPLEFAKYKISRATESAQELEPTYNPKWTKVRHMKEVKVLDGLEKQKLKTWLNKTYSY